MPVSSASSCMTTSDWGFGPILVVRFSSAAAVEPACPSILEPSENDAAALPPHFGKSLRNDPAASISACGSGLPREQF
jgi:hypothetical protein